MVYLPVHDAVAVQREHLKWAEETMLECWDRQMDTKGLAKVRLICRNTDKEKMKAPFMFMP